MYDSRRIWFNLKSVQGFRLKLQLTDNSQHAQEIGGYIRREQPERHVQLFTS